MNTSNTQEPFQMTAADMRAIEEQAHQLRAEMTARLFSAAARRVARLFKSHKPVAHGAGSFAQKA